MGIKQKKKEKKIKNQNQNQNGRLKKTELSRLPIVKNFSQQFYRLVVGLVGLIDSKGIDFPKFY